MQQWKLLTVWCKKHLCKMFYQVPNCVTQFTCKDCGKKFAINALSSLHLTYVMHGFAAIGTGKMVLVQWWYAQIVTSRFAIIAFVPSSARVVRLGFTKGSAMQNWPWQLNMHFCQTQKRKLTSWSIKFMQIVLNNICLHLLLKMMQKCWHTVLCHFVIWLWCGLSMTWLVYGDTKEAHCNIFWQWSSWECYG